MIKSGVRITFLIFLVALSIFIWEKIRNFNFFGEDKINTTHNMVIEKVISMGKMELVKYTFKDVVEQEIVRDFLPDPKAILIVQGEAVGCIDFTKLKKDDISSKNDTLVVILPKPEICYHKIDHSKSKIYETSYAFMNESVLLDEAYKKAEEKILTTALENDILKQTEFNAKIVLVPILENLTSKKVVIRFRLESQIPPLK